jgi:phosphopantothenate synthetase
VAVRCSRRDDCGRKPLSCACHPATAAIVDTVTRCLRLVFSLCRSTQMSRAALCVCTHEFGAIGKDVVRRRNGERKSLKHKEHQDAKK